MDDRRRIPAEQATAYERWELPLLNGEQRAAPAQDDVTETAGELVDVGAGIEVPLSPVTAEDLEHITQQAYDEGLQAGHEEGLQQGLAEGQQQGLSLGLAEGQEKGYAEGQAAIEAELRPQLQQQLQQLAALAEAFAEPLLEQRQAIENSLQQLVGQIAEAVLTRELQTDPGLVARLVQDSVDVLPVSKQVIQIEVCAANLAEIKAAVGSSPEHWQWRGVAELKPGQCRVRTDDSLVDNSIQQRLRRVCMEFLGLSDPLTEDSHLLNEQILAADPADSALT